MTFANFWLPVFRAWLMYVPAFVVGIVGAVVQVKRLRLQLDEMVASHTKALAGGIQAQLDAQTAELKEGRE